MHRSCIKVLSQLAHGRKESSSSCLGYSKRPRDIWSPNPFGPNGADTPLTLALLENCKSGFLKGVFPCVLLSSSSKPESLSSSQSVSDGLGMQAQESQKFPQVFLILTYDLIWAESSSQGRSNPPRQEEKLLSPPLQWVPVQTLKQNLSKVLSLRH